MINMLESLPEELLDLCWSHCDTPELRALRLCSKAILPGASSRLFHHVVLFPTKSSAQKCQKIMEDDTIRSFVTGMTFKHDSQEEDDGLKDDSDGGEADDDAEFSDVDDDDDDDAEPPKHYKQCCQVLHRFPNLQSIGICFSENVVAPEKGDEYHWYPEVEKHEGLEFRDNVMKCILAGLHTSAATVKRLSVANLQDVIVEATSDMESFKSLLSGLNTLELQIATERDDSCPENNISKPELHTFFNQDLSRIWLKPLQTQLTSLTLYSDAYWGYFPELPLEDLHFPHLASLALGNYTFAYDTQLNWILSHGQTLRSLSLDDCPILFHCTMYCGFLANRKPHDLKKFEEDYSSEETWLYEARWHDYFPKIQSGLPKLKDFHIGHGEGWESSDGPMVGRHTLGQDLVDERYIAFHGATGEILEIMLEKAVLILSAQGPSQWIEPREKTKVSDDASFEVTIDYDGCWDDEDKPRRPDCKDQDVEALSELLKVLRSRGGTCTQRDPVVGSGGLLGLVTGP